MVAPLVFIGGYIILVRWLAPLLIWTATRIGRLGISIAALCVLAPEGIFASLRRGRGEQPVGWLATMSDLVANGEDSLGHWLISVPLWRKRHNRIAIVLLIILLLIPVFIYFGNNAGGGAQTAADWCAAWYERIDFWGHS